jgi:N utilization substance protein A
LAIGKKGQNARLAAKLTGYKIDIKPESEVEFVDDDEFAEDDQAAAQTDATVDDQPATETEASDAPAEDPESDSAE